MSNNPDLGKIKNPETNQVYMVGIARSPVFFKEHKKWTRPSSGLRDRSTQAPGMAQIIMALAALNEDDSSSDDEDSALLRHTTERLIAIWQILRFMRCSFQKQHFVT